MELCERILMDQLGNDWFVPDIVVDFINDLEYKIYSSECQEEYEEREDYG
jgi:hypothetical protein